MAQVTSNARTAQSRARSAQNAHDWDRLNGEGAKAFQAFTSYRDLPASERSLAAVSQQLSKSKSLCARWSTEFRWVERAVAWDSHQDQLRRKRRAAEREKIQERQLQNNRIAAQALMTPLIALAKRAQANADAFADVSTSDLARMASAAARALPRIHEDERNLVVSPDEITTPQMPAIVGAEFCWVQSRCECGHPWGKHDQLTTDLTPDGQQPMPCTVQDCGCAHFQDSDPDE